MYPIYEILFVYLYIDSFILIVMITKLCTKCNRELPLELFNKGNSRFGRRSYCRECEHQIQNSPERRARRNELRRLRRSNPEIAEKERQRNLLTVHSNKKSLLLALLRAAKQRAKIKGLEFSITSDDLELPEICPLLSIPLKPSWGKADDCSYSIDRLDSTKGYIPGNVWIISRRANVIKNNATLEELDLLVTNLKEKLK